jgi:hypothetical protein
MTALASNVSAPEINDAFQLVHGLTAYQEPIDTAPELGLRRVVGQVHSAPHLAELGAGAMEARAAGGRAETLEQERGRPIAIVDRAGDAHQIMKFAMDESKIQVATHNRFEAGHFGPPAGHGGRVPGAAEHCRGF